MNMNVFSAHISAIFRHPESSSGQVLLGYNPQNELHLNEK